MKIFQNKKNVDKLSNEQLHR